MAIVKEKTLINTDAEGEYLINKGFRKALSCHYASSNCYYEENPDASQIAPTKDIKKFGKSIGLNLSHQAAGSSVLLNKLSFHFPDESDVGTHNPPSDKANIHDFTTV
ncbi:hypothetical protein CBL_20798 [Carabus blaptoides fortunei]